MSSLNDISNLNESLTQGGKYTSNKSDLLGSFTELKENANEVIHSTIEQFLPGHFDDVSDNGTDVSFVDTSNMDISLNVLIDNFKDLAYDFDQALTALKADGGYLRTIGGLGNYDLSFGYATGTDINTNLSSYSGYSSPDTSSNIYFVSRVNDPSGNVAASFQYSKLIDHSSSLAADPSEFTDVNAPDHLQLTCGNLPEISSSANFWSVEQTSYSPTVTPNVGNNNDNTGTNGDMLAIDDQSMNDFFDIGTDSDLQNAGRRMCNPYNIIQDNAADYGSNTAGEKFAKVTYHATKIKALVEEINRRIMAGEKITDAEGNEIALTLAQLNEKYDSLLKENANVDAHLETESLKFDTENMIYIGMLVATITAMAVGFTSLAKRTDTV